jgi:hypothetical protein
MPITAQTDPEFQFKGVEAPAAEPADELGPLAQLVGEDGKGEWVGEGFNTIWRPHALAGSGQDRFLELNLTSEKLIFNRIKGQIPNRGLLMPDINMFGLTYLQEIEGTDPKEGLHIEPGIWINVPPTTNPALPATEVRMASIPHGTTILAPARRSKQARTSAKTTSSHSRLGLRLRPTQRSLRRRPFSRS